MSTDPITEVKAAWAAFEDRISRAALLIYDSRPHYLKLRNAIAALVTPVDREGLRDACRIAIVADYEEHEKYKGNPYYPGTYLIPHCSMERFADIAYATVVNSGSVTQDGIDRGRLRADILHQIELSAKSQERDRLSGDDEELVFRGQGEAYRAVIDALDRGDFDAPATVAPDGVTDAAMLDWLVRNGVLVAFNNITGKFFCHWPYGKTSDTEDAPTDGPEFDTAREAIADAMKESSDR